MTQTWRIAGTLGALALCAMMGSPCHAQALETETARFLRKGTAEIGTGFEMQSSREGIERALPFAFEYGVADHFSLLVEPVAYTSIRPKRSTGATGGGDLEVTAFYLVRAEAGGVPALAVAGEVKLPTAKSRLIGTGKTDYAAYLIGSKRLGRLDAHANLGYTINGQPAGTKLNNTVSGALAGELHVTPVVEVYAEALGTTSSAPEGGGDNPASTSAKTPEAAGGEMVGTLGIGVSPVPHLLLSLGMSYDNNHALLMRPGVLFRMR